MALRLRRGTDAERLLITPLQGEPIFTTDTKRLYVGDGSTVGGVLVTGDQSNTQVSADTTPQLGGDLDLNGNNITGAGNIAIDGTITATGSINLGDGDEDAIAVGGLINTNLRPAIDGAYDIGTSLRRWNNVWAEGANISGQLTTDSISVEKIISQDSTVLYEASSNTVTADFVGPLTGNADGDHTGSFTGRIVGGEVFRNVINKFDSNDVNITGGKLSNVQIGDYFVSGVEIVADRVESNGGLFGTLFGSVHGDVFTDDSSLLVDATNSQIFGAVKGEILTDRKVFINGSARDEVGVEITTLSQDPAISIRGPGDGELQGPSITLTSHDSSSLYSDYNSVGVGDSLGQLRFGTERTDNPGEVGSSSIITSVLEQLGDNNTTFNQSDIRFVLLDGPNFPGIYQARLSREVGFTAPVITPGTYADATARDAAITTPVAGMMVFLTDGDGAGNPKFQGYDGSAWVDLN